MKALIHWEFAAIMRFPIPELVTGMLAFQAFSFRDGALWYSIPPEAAWPQALSFVTTTIALSLFSNLSELYLPAAALSAVIAALLFTHENETGGLRNLLSLPVTRREVFWVKSGTLTLVIGCTIFLTLALSAALASMNSISGLFTPNNRSLFPGLLLASILTAAGISGIAVLWSVAARSTAVALLGSLASLFVPWFAGQASRFPLLPPDALRRSDALLYLANPLAGHDAWFIPAVAVYSAVGVATFGIAAWIFENHTEIR